MVLCRVTRDPLTSTFFMTLEGKEGIRPWLLLSARRKRKGKHFYYIMSSEKGRIEEDGPGFAGLVKGNFGGTKFHIFDNGRKVGGKAGQGSSSAPRRELAILRFGLPHSPRLIPLLGIRTHMGSSCCSVLHKEHSRLPPFSSSSLWGIRSCVSRLCNVAWRASIWRPSLASRDPGASTTTLQVLEENGHQGAP